MKIAVSIFVLCAVIAFVQSTPVPQEVEVPAEAAAPNRPLLNVISAAADTASLAFNGLANTGLNVVKSVAEGTSKVIGSAAGAMTTGINTAAQTITSTLSLPFQAAQSK